ncbi:pilus assembly protein [Dokdonella soli]|uniref:PilY1 beta-propeller domain-containing protein n=1 Tax=Dokdonella soli TaxID=529810 RepID=A0ABN1ICR7_9GAMM
MTRLNRFLTQLVSSSLVLLFGLANPGAALHAQTTLSNVPVFSAFSVPANLMLALSVEFPTGTVAAYTGATGFSSANTYLGYFDPAKCYTYQSDTATPANPLNNYFVPIGPIGTGCVDPQWSGNLLNWASMTALDEFRQVLSGGYRVVDTASLTVLQRSRQTAQGSASNFPTKSITSPAGLVPAPFSLAPTVYIRSHNGGTELTSGTDRGVFIEVADNSGFVNDPVNGFNDTLYYARVQVCVAGLLESNCNSAHASTDYPNAGKYNKPEGLIQEHANQIRVGATGYLYALGLGHPNGVLRAQLRDNGPTAYVGNGPRIPNTNAEWDGGTGVFTQNPDPAAASASGVPNSGAINYLNQFGLVEPGYETYDTIAELYWATLSYYKNLPLDASYSAPVNSGNSIQLDGFPAISSANATDPIQYSCQGNAIVTIGDSHTWCDAAVPGSKLSNGGRCTNQTALTALAANGTDPGLDTGAYLKALGALPLIEKIGATPASNSMIGYAAVADLSTTYEFNAPDGATYNMAGMAYYAHTQDIRGDNPSYVNPVSKVNSTTGKQTVDTYTVDVMEPGSYDGSSGRETYDPANVRSNRGPNMYWLAAKYGGFDVDDTQCSAASPPTPCVTVNGNKVPTPESFLDWHTNTTTVAAKNLRPDNYFPGNRPDLIHSGLATIFNRVASKKVLSAVGPGTTSTRSLGPADATIYKIPSPATGFVAYTTKYTPGDWTGDVLGAVSTIAADGTVNPATIGTPAVLVQWSAKANLKLLAELPDASAKPTGWDTTRRIITMGSAGGIPFRWSNLTSAEQTALSGDTGTAHPLLDFLRGDRSNEGTKFRTRRSVLGDIVDSEAVLVQGALALNYNDANNPGYSAFTTARASRAPVVYVGSNDGMLHAFSADFSGITSPASAPALTDGGNELFAYVPSFLFNGPNSTPGIDGLAALGNLAGVTTNAYAHHFYVDQTPQIADADFDRTGLTPTGSGAPDWHTVLVGAVGKGGKGIYALDVTTVPAALSAGTSTTQETAIAQKVLWEFAPADMGYLYGKPNIAKTRKYGWVVLVTTGYNNASGIGSLFVLNAKTGALLETLSTTVGSPTDPSGLGRMAAYTQDFTDNTIEQVYAGDLKGNVWRFDLSGTGPGAYPAPALLATLTASDGTAQPITTAPRVEVDLNSTGLSTRRWVFVGTGRFLDVGDLTTTQTQTMYALRDGTGVAPRTTGLPLSRSAAGVSAITSILTGLTIADSAGGWYFDLLGSPTGSAAERVIVDPDSQAGVPIIAWATLVPGADPCSYQGAIYAVNYGTGVTALLDSHGVAVASISPPGGAPTKVALQRLPDGSVGLLYGSLNGGANVQKIGGINPTTFRSRVNWREILN